MALTLINGNKPRHPVAFAFDVDGVLIKGKTALPGAKETIELVQELGIPFIFLTNGGVQTEAEHVKNLAAHLGLASLHQDQLVQSHKCRHLLQCSSDTQEYSPVPPRNGDASLPNHGLQQDEQPGSYFSNSDFEWATDQCQPRFAQGAFREALKGIWRHATGGKAELKYSVVGKPTETTYAYAKKVIFEMALRLRADDCADIPPSCPSMEIGTVYMVGDNPENE
ncbi:hypothetical protein ACRALDRAFT_1078921 [Sodiomyces alcalophilus JCM 7366]|uniref:uncharacterized protein n=1 Tax=Sodiomyces alcalophilus JCM 7366 TaxID=591952 RepID=UPI0039B5150C